MDQLAFLNMARAYFENIPLTIYLPETEENITGIVNISNTQDSVVVTISGAYQPSTTATVEKIQVLEKLATDPALYTVTWLTVDTCTLSPSPQGIIQIGDVFDIAGSKYEVAAINGDDITFTTAVSEVSVFYASVATPDVTYQWQISEDGGTTWSDIPGATDRQYAPNSGDVGDNLRVIISYTDGQGTIEEPALSPPSSQPLIINPVYPIIADIDLALSRVYQANVLATLTVAITLE